MTTCQECKRNPANFYFHVESFAGKQKVRLCDACYHEKKDDLTALTSLSHIFDGFFSNHLSEMNGSRPTKVKTKPKPKRNGILDRLAKNLNDKANEGAIDPIIGRNEEIDQVIETLNRRNKNNPVLIGEPGVGKTAIAEGLALKIVQGDVPEKLLDKEIYSLDVSSVVAGTGIRGQFEEKMRTIISELEQREEVILFIDEIHLIVGAGSAEGSLDAANILKPALARGSFQIVGATTLKEYRKIEKDGALERRFQPIIVDEPTKEEALAILRGLKDHYESFHGVRYPDDILKACVNLSSRYIQDRQLPDKAIDILDVAGSKLNLQHTKEANASKHLSDELERIQAEKEQAIEQQDFERAADLREEELKVDGQLQEAEQERNTPSVTLALVESIIENMTGIPVAKLQKEEQEKLSTLESTLQSRVIGQDEAAQKVAKAIRRSRAGLKPKNRPTASFLFVGPTGVGKTELTKVLAEELFGTRDSMIRLDMSEYMEKHSVSKLIGSPPGYVGHEEAGQLTEQVRRNPYSIILLDEIEKAHPDVQNAFLQVLEDGILTDSQGRRVNFKETVIIATSNAGSSVKPAPTLGFGTHTEKETSVMANLKDYFRPEFLNRFDNIIAFQSLEEDHLVDIVDLMLADLRETLKERNVTLNVTEDAKRAVAKIGYDKAFGARPLRRAIQEQFEDAITDHLLANEDITSLSIDAKDRDITVQAQ